MFKRFFAVALAMAALAGCESSGYDRYPNQGYYPDQGYYGRYPYYGGGFGSYYGGGDYDRYYHPGHGVSCDRARDICYDRYGPSYFATAKYLGDREANHAYKKYGDSVFLFSPRSGVSCDRRTKECSDGAWPDHVMRQPATRLDQRKTGAIGAAPGLGDDVLARPIVPTQGSSEEGGIPRRIQPQAGPPMAGNEDEPIKRIRPEVQPERPTGALPRTNADMSPRATTVCPTRTCGD